VDSQVTSIKNSVEECYAEGGDAKSHNIDVHTVKEQFKKTVTTELSVAKVEIYESAKTKVVTKVEVDHTISDTDSKVNVINEQSGSVTVVAGKNEATTVTDVVETGSSTVDIVTVENDTCAKTEGSAVDVVVDSSRSKVDVITKESGSVAVMTGEKEAATVTDVIKTDSTSVGIVTGKKDTVVKNDSSVVDVVLGGSDAKVHVITKESGSATSVAGEKETTNVIGVIETDSATVDVVTEKKGTVVKTEGSAVGVVIGSTDSKVDLITKESGSITVVAGEKKTTTATDDVKSG
ncbi:hypothetical protein, partial, partial [Parasitella parasitica]